MRKCYISLILTVMCLCNSFLFGDDYWESIYSSDESIHCLAINSSGDLFAGTNTGILRSTDNGVTWNNVLDSCYVHTITINFQNYIYASPSPLYLSVDNGISWSQLNLNYLYGVTYVTTDSKDNIFAGFWGGISKSNDNGVTWKLVLSISDCEAVYSIVENSQGVLFAGTINFIGTGDGGGVYRSTDQGENWEHIGLAYEYVSSLAINSSDEIFAGSRGQNQQGGGGVFRSSDGGGTWIELCDDVLVTSIAIDSEDKIFIGCSDLDGYIGAVHYSQDNGQTWQRIQSDLVDIYTGIEFLLISDDDYAYAISYGGSINDIFRSVNPTVGVGIDDPPIQESTIRLTNYPNPFSSTTTISFYTCPTVQEGAVEIYNIKGQLIRELQCYASDGALHAVWNGRDSFQKIVLPGIYFYRIHSGNLISQTDKMVYIQ